MARDPIASRYADALFGSAKTPAQRHEALEQLMLIRRLLAELPLLRQFMGNPDVEPQDKLGVLDRALRGGWSPLVRAFVRLVVSMGRPESLPQMVDAFEALVDAAERRMRVVVRSAREVPESALKRLRAQLEQREGKQVELRTELVPELLGGVQIQLDHRVIDGSVRRQLEELRERLTTVRVH